MKIREEKCHADMTKEVNYLDNLKFSGKLVLNFRMRVVLWGFMAVVV